MLALKEVLVLLVELLLLGDELGDWFDGFEGGEDGELVIGPEDVDDAFYGKQVLGLKT